MTTLNSFLSPATQLIQPNKHLSLSISPSYHLTSTSSKPFLNPNIVAKIRCSAFTEDRELAPTDTDRTGDENEDEEENASVSTKMEGINFSLFSITYSSDRLLNAAIVLGAGSLAITKLLTIDHDYWQGWTLYEVLRYAPEHNWNAYEEALKTNPVLAKMAISGIVYSLGDWIAQALLPSKDWWVVLAKVAFDQSVWAAIWNSIYFVVLGFLRLESPVNIFDELKATFWPMLTAGWKLWPFAHLITYGVIPLEQRLLWVDCVELIWVTILSTYSNEKSEMRISETSESQPDSPLDKPPKKMRRTLSKPFSTAIATLLKTPNPPNSHSSPSSFKRPFSTSTPLPPPEWVHPFNDLSDLITTGPKSGLQPSPWVPKILHILQNTALLEQDLSVFCQKYLIKLPSSFVAYILKQSGQFPNRAETAFRFFIWAGKQKGYAHNLECYVFVIEVLCSETDFDRAKLVFDDFKSKGLLMNSSAANSLIRSFGNGGMVEELIWVWRKMKENGVEPSLYTYNFLMNGLVDSMFLESAEKVFEVMENGKVKPDIVTYNTMIKGYCKSGNLRKAMERFHDMETRNVGPDKITFLTLMQACYSETDYDSCLRLYNEMRDKGLDIPSHAYSLVIGGLCKDGKSLEGYAVFENMVTDGRGPNVAIYTALIDAYAKNGDLEKAMGLFRRMQSEGFEPDEVTYGVIVNSLCRNGRLEEALEWFDYCTRHNVVINAVLYSSLIDGLGKAGRLEEAEKLFEEMGCVRDSYCYNVLIDALAKNGKVDEALTFFERMEEEGCGQTVYTFTILIDGLFRARRNEEALRMWDMMMDKGITPNSASFRALSTGLCLSGKVARACKILDELAPMGIVLETAFEDMMNVLCRAGRVMEACRLADGVVERGGRFRGG
ncbi:pentatricopeptide repeat-containing protein at1g03560 mitochondrial [Phtheirospermum japonicum]|uniref:Pentatricopeptide repeat-containing protein at1g03560 mitochondrial n=1 Tax=Phtheirospermum japonicum TaxID=374723 RepID=A0A830B1M2_9LAMI|nr:pentatricopeptide repeat-containing protein at1g03560 mitochondrial [Phtheirospermum japonicum]